LDFFEHGDLRVRVATRLRCGGMSHNDFIANLPVNFEYRRAFGEATCKSLVSCISALQCIIMQADSRVLHHRDGTLSVVKKVSVVSCRE